MNTNSNSVAKYYQETSYNLQLLNPSVTTLAAIDPTTKVPVAAPTTCDWSRPSAAQADAALTKAGYVIGNYQNIFYVFPRSSTRPRHHRNRHSAAGRDLPTSAYGRAWSNGYNQLSVYAHELGHNFGLLHAARIDCGSVTLSPGAAGCSVTEYGDPFVVMGNQSAGHFDALQKTLIDPPSGPWISGSAVKTHVSGTATYTLGPIESAGVSTYAVKIPTAAANRTYWLEYRQPVGLFDTFISAANSGLQVRVSSPFELNHLRVPVTTTPKFST